MLLLITPVLADEAQDATDLLTESLKCPVKIYTWDHGSRRGAVTYQVINKYLGNKRRLQFVSEFKEDGGDRWTQQFTAGFRELGQVSISEARGKPEVHISCSGSQGCVEEVRQDFDRDTGEPYPPEKELLNSLGASLPVCDQETAENVVAAIETLIRLNKPNR